MPAQVPLLPGLLSNAALPASIMTLLLRSAMDDDDARDMVAVLSRADVPESCLQDAVAFLSTKGSSDQWAVVAKRLLSRTHVPPRVLAAAVDAFEAGATCFTSGLACHPAALTSDQARRILAGRGWAESAADLMAPLASRAGCAWLTERLTANSVPLTVLAGAVGVDVPLDVLVPAIVRSPVRAELLLDELWARRPQLSGQELAARVAVTGDLTWTPTPGQAQRPGLLAWDDSPVRFDAPGLVANPNQMYVDAASADPATATRGALALLETVQAERLLNSATAGVRAVLTSPVIDAELKDQLMKALLDSMQNTQVLDELDLITWSPSWSEQVAVKYPLNALRLHGWAPFGGPQNAPTVVTRVQQMAADPTVRPSVNLPWFLEMVISHGLTAQILDVIQVANLHLLTSADVNTSARVAAAETMATYLETNLPTSAHWDVYTTLAANFNGTLGELMAVARAVATS